MIYEFSDLTLDLDRHLLTRGEQPIKLTKLSFKVLQALVQAAPALISQDDLIDQVWGHKRVITPDNLSQRMKILRQSLGDDPNQPIYIEGVRGEGYRLVPEVKIQSAQTSSRSFRRAPSSRLLVSLGVLALALGYIAFDKFVFTESIQTATTASAARFEKSLAVLPFAASGDEEGGGLFAAGIHADLLTQLAKIADLHVISRTSVMEYAGTAKNMVQIRDELGVNHILEGGVQKIGDQVRMNAQLIDARTDKLLWTETFDRELTVNNIFSVQSEIVEKITDSLHATLLPETSASIALAPTDNMEAFRDYMTARYGSMGTDVRIELLQSAVEKDPRFALAWLWLVYYWQQLFWFGEDASGLERALEALQRVEAIDPDLPELHLVRAIVHYHGFLRYEDALEELERAEKAMPGYSRNFAWRGTIYRHMGRLPEAIQAYQRALELDPRNRAATHELARTLVLGRYYDDARDLLKASITKFPENAWFSRWFLAMVDWYQFGDSRPLLRVLNRPERPDSLGTDALTALSAWLADETETALRHARRIDPNDFGDTAFTQPPVGLNLVSEDIAMIRAAILMASGADDEGRAILEASRVELTQFLSEQDEPSWFFIQKLSYMLALLGASEQAVETAEEMIRRYEEEPKRAIFPFHVQAYHGMLMCQVGDLSRAEEDFRWVLSRVNQLTLASLVNGWPPCRDKFKETEHYLRLKEEFDHLSRGKTLE